MSPKQESVAWCRRYAMEDNYIHSRLADLDLFRPSSMTSANSNFVCKEIGNDIDTHMFKQKKALAMFLLNYHSTATKAGQVEGWHIFNDPAKTREDEEAICNEIFERYKETAIQDLFLVAREANIRLSNCIS